jgi:glycosyltransferase involved in cell wall biosynthesis
MVFELMDRIYFPFWLAHSFKKNQIDAYFGTFADFFPPFFFSKMKKTWLIHDLVWKLYPETLQINKKLIYRFSIPRKMKRADMLFSVSENTKKDIRELLNIKTEIHVTPNAADRSIFFKADVASISTIKKKYGITRPYILSVCTLEPRKNLETLLYAFEKMAEHARYHLVLVGMRGWIKETFFSLIDEIGIGDHVITTGYVPEEDLAPLYSGAEIFVFPSLYEGFGLPVLEAMQCGCPVISSNSSSLPEVLGDSGTLVDSMDIESFREAIETVLGDTSLRRKMSEKGLERSKLFSWDRSARLVLEKLTAP